MVKWSVFHQVRIIGHGQQVWVLADVEYVVGTVSSNPIRWWNRSPPSSIMGNVKLMGKRSAFHQVKIIIASGVVPHVLVLAQWRVLLESSHRTTSDNRIVDCLARVLRMVVTWVTHQHFTKSELLSALSFNASPTWHTPLKFSCWSGSIGAINV